MPEDAKSQPALGFLTVVDDRQHGLFGGYLVVNASGKPLEFHCTAPIKPNRAQEILYGPTLLPYLYGEQIGKTLLAAAKADPLVVCTDREPALALGEHLDVPVVLVLPQDHPADRTGGDLTSSGHSDKAWRVDTAHTGGHGLVSFQFWSQPSGPAGD